MSKKTPPIKEVITKSIHTNILDGKFKPESTVFCYCCGVPGFNKTDYTTAVLDLIENLCKEFDTDPSTVIASLTPKGQLTNPVDIAKHIVTLLEWRGDVVGICALIDTVPKTMYPKPYHRLITKTLPGLFAGKGLESFKAQMDKEIQVCPCCLVRYATPVIACHILGWATPLNIFENRVQD